MTIVFAVAYRARAPKGFADKLRALVPGSLVCASQSATNTAVKGADKTIFHLNTSLTGAERTVYYGNNILIPLMQAAQPMGDVVFQLHDTVIPEAAKVQELILLLERVPSLNFASAQPVMGVDVGGQHIVLDWSGRFVAWRSSTLLQWMATFAIEDFPNAQSTMQVVMKRIRAAGAAEEVGWTWRMDMTVEEG